MRIVLGLFVAGLVAAAALPVRHRPALWALVIIFCVVPWRGFQDHPDWGRIRWIPLVSPPVRFADLAGNVALYVPLGVFYGRARQVGRTGVTQGALWGVALSVLTEATQLFSRGRFPSTGDVLMNGLGALIGGGLAARGREPRSDQP